MSVSSFALIPAALLLDSRIGASELRVYAALALHANKSRTCNPTHARIAEICGFSANSVSFVSVSIKKLVAAGYVQVTRVGFKKPNLYHLLDVAVTASNDNLRAVSNRRISDDAHKAKRDAIVQDYNVRQEAVYDALEEAQRQLNSSDYATSLEYEVAVSELADSLLASKKSLPAAAPAFVYEPDIFNQFDNDADAELVGDFSNEFAGEFQ